MKNLKPQLMKIVFAGIFAFIKLKFLPDIDLMLLLVFAIAIDFLTGVWKAKVLGKARTSSGFRKTVTKFMQYVGAIVGGAVMAYIGEQKGGEALAPVFGWVNEGLVFFIIYIEITSIFENLYAVDPESKISIFFYQPAIKLLTFQFKNNPVIKRAEALKEETINS